MVERGPLTSHHHRPVEIVLDVFLPRPDHLDRHASRLRDQGCDHRPVLGLAAPSESSAQVMFVDRDGRRREREYPRHLREGVFAILGRGPDLGAPIGDMGDASLRFHGGVRQVGDVVVRL